MMKCEFENLIGYEITPEEYEKVETVYMAWNYKDMSKEKIADIYKNDRELVIDTLYNYIVKHDGTEVDRLKRENDRARRRIDDLEKKNNDLRDLQKKLETQLRDSCKETEIMTSAVLAVTKELGMYKVQTEELETQLHQYKTLFADIEENATVALYETLLGVAE